MGITATECAYVYGDNQSILVNSSVPDSVLRKKSNSCAFHFVMKVHASMNEDAVMSIRAETRWPGDKTVACGWEGRFILLYVATLLGPWKGWSNYWRVIVKVVLKSDYSCDWRSFDVEYYVRNVSLRQKWTTNSLKYVYTAWSLCQTWWMSEPLYFSFWIFFGFGFWIFSFNFLKHHIHLQHKGGDWWWIIITLHIQMHSDKSGLQILRGMCIQNGLCIKYGECRNHYIWFSFLFYFFILVYNAAYLFTGRGESALREVFEVWCEVVKCANGF